MVEIKWEQAWNTASVLFYWSSKHFSFIKPCTTVSMCVCMCEIERKRVRLCLQGWKSWMSKHWAHSIMFSWFLINLSMGSLPFCFPVFFMCFCMYITGENHLTETLIFLVICCHDFYSELWNYSLFFLNVNVQSFLDKKKTFRE